jgi:hypothetical protein
MARWTRVFSAAAPWQLQICRAFLPVKSDVAWGYISDLRRTENLRLDVLASRSAAHRFQRVHAAIAVR